MRKFLMILMVLAMLLTMTACRKKYVEVDAPPTVPEEQETPAGSEGPDPITLPPVEDVVIAPAVTIGRAPGGAYVLPEQPTTLMDWQWQGAVGLLAREGDVSFYAVEGKESCPALLRWGELEAEFDWWYSTPRGIEPKLWVWDIDADGEPEAVVDCYGSSGTGVSLEYIYVVEQEEGQLVSYELPWWDVQMLVEQQLRALSLNSGLYAALGQELVDISELSQRVNTDEILICLGETACYTRTEDGLECTFGVTAVGEDIPRLTEYVAEITGHIRYENSTFVLENMHLLSA